MDKTLQDLENDFQQLKVDMVMLLNKFSAKYPSIDVEGDIVSNRENGTFFLKLRAKIQG